MAAGSSAMSIDVALSSWRCVIMANLLRCYRLRAWSCTSVHSLRPHPQRLASWPFWRTFECASKFAFWHTLSQCVVPQNFWRISHFGCWNRCNVYVYQRVMDLQNFWLYIWCKLFRSIGQNGCWRWNPFFGGFTYISLFCIVAWSVTELCWGATPPGIKPSNMHNAI